MAYLLMVVTVELALLGHRLLPHARVGNCWTFALPRWRARGGYLLVRDSSERFLGVLPIPHVAWVEHLGDDTILQQTVPLHRHKRWWRSFRFPYRVVRSEAARDARPERDE
jgi:hypothetical protein